MFKFFKKKKIKANLHSVTIPDQGWTKVSEDDEAIRWVNPQQSALIVLHFFDKEPDLPTAKDLDYLKNSTEILQQHPMVVLLKQTSLIFTIFV